MKNTAKTSAKQIKKLSENRNRQRELLAEMKKSGGATQAQSREMKKLAQQAKILEQTQERQLKSTGRLAKEMKAAGTSTVNLAQNQKTLAEQMEKTNKKFAAQQKWANAGRKLDDINSKAIMDIRRRRRSRIRPRNAC